LFVGRGPELAELGEWWAQACGGRRVGFIAAQGGVGKTALVDTFADALRTRQPVLVGRGQCAGLFGAGEPYLPVLDMLAGLCAGPDGGRVREVLGRCAPTWLLQLPGLVAGPDLAGVRERAGAPGERMLHEFADAMELLAAGRGLVLILEDLQDGDRATVGLISYLARRRGPARFLLLCTYRPAELVARAHPLRQVLQDLRSRGLCAHLALELLSAADVGCYLAAWLAPRAPSPDLIAEVHRRTEGNALFMVAVTDALVAGGLLAGPGGALDAAGRLDALGIPDGVRLMIEQQVDSLDEADRRLLAVAAAVGGEFTAEAVCAGLGGPAGVPAAEVEDRCYRLARYGAVLLPAGESQWPDGTVSARYRFAHGMYREVCYERLGGPAKRALAHRSIAGWLAAAYGARAAEVADELAAHFERGGDYPGAVAHLCTAAVTAVGRSAYAEAHDHARRALGLLGRIPGRAQRSRLELQVRQAEVAASMADGGWRDPQSLANCAQLRALAIELADTGALVTALLGLHNHATAHADTAAVRGYRREIDQAAAAAPGAAVELASHFIHMRSDSSAGRCAPAWDHARAMLEIYDPAGHRHLALLLGEEVDVAAHLYAGASLWQLGYPDQARDHARAAVSSARRNEIPAGLARALWFAAVIHMLCGDTGRVREMAAELEAVCARHVLPLWRAGGVILDGWAAGTAGNAAAGLERLRRGMVGWAEIAADLAFHRCLAGELCLAAGDWAGGLAAVRAGLDIVTRTGQAHGEIELVRLHGELLLHGGAGHAGQAEELLHRAVTLAAERQARSFQLRAATSLARLWHSRGRTAQARALLGPVYGWFTEGHDTSDLMLARRLLQHLDAPRSLARDGVA
jgi:tetratricopeptide (TPR) repeat protein